MEERTDLFLIDKRYSALKLSWIIYGFILLTGECLAQNTLGPYKFWNQKSLSGAVGFQAKYRNQQQVFSSGFEENTVGSLISGKFLLESRSYIVHPNLMALDIDAEYNPEKLDRQFLVVPDRSEVRTLSRLNLRSTFFQEKDLTLNAFLNLNQNYINRENFTNSRTNRKFWGGGLFYKNKVLPFSLTYQEGNWNQKEIETDRTFKYWQRNIRGRISKSFFSRDKHIVSYSHDNYIRKETNIEARQNIVDFIELNSNVAFDAQKNYNLSTIISHLDQYGADDLKRFQVYTNLVFKLPQNFRLLGNYNFSDNQYPLYKLKQHRAKLDLGHQLFKSLKTNIYAEYANNSHSLYREIDYRAGFYINYTKKIPTGVLNIGYHYYNREFIRESGPVSLKVINEEHILSDDEILLLNKPSVDPESIVVKDLTGTIIYQVDFDYLIFEQNDYIEIKRIPGGEIPNNAAILVDYSTILPGDYNYNLDNQMFFLRVILFKQFLELYYRRGKQNYKNIDQPELITLNYYVQNVYGIQFTFDFARLGIEYDDYASSIVPYQLIRYFADLHWRFNNKLLLSFIGNIRDYQTIGERENELYADLSGKVAYHFSSKTKLNLEMGYREQRGYQIDLNMLTARMELNWVVRKIYLTVGLEVYRRNYLDRETINFNGAYFNVIRKF
ncbi:MAG: hypothetical protein KQI35_06240 [Bacteroidetes bacterium]|nr:hypothetical protein [Bacteroidota bacterium]